MIGCMVLTSSGSLRVNPGTGSPVRRFPIYVSYKVACSSRFLLPQPGSPLHLFARRPPRWHNQLIISRLLYSRGNDEAPMIIFLYGAITVQSTVSPAALPYATLPAIAIKKAWASSCNDQSPTFLIRRRRACSSATFREKASYVYKYEHNGSA